MKDRKIVVVMGGPSSEAEVSRRSAAAVLAALKSKGYNAEELEFSPRNFFADMQRLRPDIVFNAMHGAYGEDGRMQAVLDLMGIPCTGSGVLASAMSMDKAAAKNVMLGAGISTPKARAYRTADRAGLRARILREMSVPMVVKPTAQGSSVGVVVVKDAAELPDALDEAFAYGDEVLVEEFIDGPELTAAVWGTPDTCDALPVIEITTTSGRYDYESKYTVGASRHIIPARISATAMERVRETAERTFRVFGCRGVARIDMMLSSEDVPYVIDINTMPGLTETSLVPDAARAAGISFEDFCERLLEMTIKECGV